MKLGVALIVVYTACHSEPALPDAVALFCTDQMPRAPTFTNMQVLFGSCITCHTEGVPLDLRPPVSYADLVGQVPPDYTDPATDESCGGILVEPGNPGASYLFQKVSSDTPCAGSRMPLTDIGVPSPLAACAQTLIHDWIMAGAPND